MKCIKGAVTFIVLTLTLMQVAGLPAFGFLGFGNSASWKEEVMLHDGQKIIVNRAQSHGGRHEIGQPPPIKEHSITFTLPGSNNIITWKDEYSEDVGAANFLLLALHVLNRKPYLVASPDGCIAYNKWGSQIHLMSSSSTTGRRGNVSLYPDCPLNLKISIWPWGI